MTRISSFNVSYDADGDVLYISRRREAAARGVEDRYGIVWRYDSRGELIGATVLDFADRWGAHEAQLADQLSERFNIPARQMMNVLEHARDEK